MADISSKVLNSEELVRTSTNHLNNIIDGATPKLTISARESSWTPKSDFALRTLATQPSSKSQIAAKIINHAALYSLLPINTTVIAEQPNIKLIRVAWGSGKNGNKQNYLDDHVLLCQRGAGALVQADQPGSGGGGQPLGTEAQRIGTFRTAGTIPPRGVAGRHRIQAGS